ncbi:hypothetical protein F5890DRAFT_1586555 [Lentinula detonsa]|uniref:Uncharacterized protein n=1 Tax=Lentinula detonsa TaxID=2804962 RepID=A0AA38PZ39_9AGAR|nr:hypothetical protein F5890DRAFT_1586555 [Lentinula detonsa]
MSQNLRTFLKTNTIPLFLALEMLAKPSSNLSPYLSTRETSSFAQSMSECTRKRKRQAEDDDFDPSNPQSQDEKHKTRRINPYKLAERLPSGLVKEMETFIEPGAIMPNFDIRKELQTRYQVDRRHIYDYFHSRGLRVAKEDRHSNLTRSRIAKAKAQVQVQCDDGAKENIPFKFTNPVKVLPVKRSSSKPKHARKSVKRPVEAMTEALVLCDSSQVQDTESADVKSSESDNDEVDSVDVSLSNDIDVFADVVPEVVESSPCFYSEHAFVSSSRSTPSLVDDSSSSCKSPSPGVVQPEEELFSAAEFAAEFLNLPEDSESQDYSIDTTFDLSFAPSMIGDLMCPSDRKNMYEHIDTNIVSNGTSFALDLSALQPETINHSSLPTAAALPPLLPSLSLDSYIKALQTIASVIPNAVPACQTLLPTPMSLPVTSNGYSLPATLSNSTYVLTPSDFLTPGFRQADSFSFSPPGAPYTSTALYTSTDPFHHALQNEQRTVHTGRSI